MTRPVALASPSLIDVEPGWLAHYTPLMLYTPTAGTQRRVHEETKGRGAAQEPEPNSAIGDRQRYLARTAPRTDDGKCVPLLTLVEANKAGRRVEVM